MTALSGVRNSWLICAISSLHAGSSAPSWLVRGGLAGVRPPAGLSVSSATPVPVAIRKARCHAGSPPMMPLAAAAGSCQAVVSRTASPAR